MEIHEAVEDVSETADEKGFWDDQDVDDRFPEAIALCHSELSEALEAHRKDNIATDDGVVEELADTVIRVFDLADKVDRKYGTDFVATMEQKMEYNKHRERKHGKRY